VLYFAAMSSHMASSAISTCSRVHVREEDRLEWRVELEECGELEDVG